MPSPHPAWSFQYTGQVRRYFFLLICILGSFRLGLPGTIAQSHKAFGMILGFQSYHVPDTESPQQFCVFKKDSTGPHPAVYLKCRCLMKYICPNSQTQQGRHSRHDYQASSGDGTYRLSRCRHFNKTFSVGSDTCNCW